MKTIYKAKKTKVTELLDDVDRFMNEFESFNKKHPQYSYELNITKEGINWVANVNINKDETEKNKTT